MSQLANGSCSKNSVFSLRHGSFIGVPKQWNTTLFPGSSLYLETRGRERTLGTRLNGTADMLLYQTNSVWVQLFSYVNAFFVPINLHGCWTREWKGSIGFLFFNNINLLFGCFFLLYFCSRWLRLCVRAAWQKRYSHTVTFITMQGRMKYIRPLYK